MSEALSKNGRNMTTFKKFMKQEERKFEVVNLNINTVSNLDLFRKAHLLVLET